MKPGFPKTLPGATLLEQGGSPAGVAQHGRRPPQHGRRPPGVAGRLARESPCIRGPFVDFRVVWPGAVPGSNPTGGASGAPALVDIETDSSTKVCVAHTICKLSSTLGGPRLSWSSVEPFLYHSHSQFRLLFFDAFTWRTGTCYHICCACDHRSV